MLNVWTTLRKWKCFYELSVWLHATCSRSVSQVGPQHRAWTSNDDKSDQCFFSSVLPSVQSRKSAKYWPNKNVHSCIDTYPATTSSNSLTRHDRGDIMIILRSRIHSNPDDRDKLPCLIVNLPCLALHSGDVNYDPGRPTCKILSMPVEWWQQELMQTYA